MSQNLISRLCKLIFEPGFLRCSQPYCTCISSDFKKTKTRNGVDMVCHFLSISVQNLVSDPGEFYRYIPPVSLAKERKESTEYNTNSTVLKKKKIYNESQHSLFFDLLVLSNKTSLINGLIL